MAIYVSGNGQHTAEYGEHEDGSQCPSMHHHYGRRIEPNRSWTVYHVYSGLPAAMGKHSATGLTETTATAMMMSLNANNLERRRAARLKQSAIDALPAWQPKGQRDGS